MAHITTNNKVAVYALRFLVVALAVELALCAAVVSTTWALEDSSSASDVKVTYDGTSLVWSGVEIDKDGNVNLDLFSKSYFKDEQLVVCTSGDSNVIAPGTLRDVNITFVNATDKAVTLNSTVNQSATILVGQKTYDIVPFENIIFKSNATAQAATSESSSEVVIDAAAGKKTYSASQNVDPGGSTSGTISWAWPFDNYDSQDTFFGNMAADGNPIKVTVTLDVEVVQDLQNATSQTRIPNVLEGSALVQTGDLTPLMWLCVLSVLTGFALIACVWEARNGKQVKK